MQAIDKHLSSLNLSWTWNPATSIGVGEATQNVWSRAYRRAQERKVKDDQSTAGGETADDMAVERDEGKEKGEVQLAFRVRVVELARQVDLEWLKGTNQVLWESFCGLMHRESKKW